jgi:hypothetical protein
MSAFLPKDHLKVEHEYTAGTWQDFTADLVTVSLSLREFEGRHTAALTFYNSSMDPAESSGTRVVKKGDRVRVHMKNNAGTLRKAGTFSIVKVGTAIDLRKPPGRQYLVTIQLEGNGVAGVAGTGGSSGVDAIDDLSNTITGAPYEIGGDGFGSGRTTPSGAYVEVAYNEVASEFDQILATRDSNPGVIAFEDPEGTIQVFDSATQRTGPAAHTIDGGDYSNIDMTFDMSHIVNVLHIKYLEKIKGTATKPTRTVEHDHTYEDAPSIAKYGRFKRTHTVHKKSDFAAYAAGVFARNADPELVPRSVTIPVRKTAELRPGYQDGHYVGSKVDVVSPDGLTTYTCRVKRISHSITNRRWLVQVFLRPPDVVTHRRRPLSTEVANNPDGTVLNAHIDDLAVDSRVLDDLAVTNGKLDDNAVDSRVIAPGSVTGTALDPALDATGVVITGPELNTGPPGDNRVRIYDVGPYGVVEFSSGDATEDAPASLRFTTDGAGHVTFTMNTGVTTAESTAAQILMQPGPSLDGATVDVYGTTTLHNPVIISAGTSLTVGGPATFSGTVAVAGTTTLNGNLVLNGNLASDVLINSGKHFETLGGTLSFWFSTGALRMAGGSAISGKIGTDFASATGSCIAFVNDQVVIGPQNYNNATPGPGNTARLDAAAIHSQTNGLFMDDLSGGGLTGASIGNGGRVQRTTSSRRYKYGVKPLALEDARHVVHALAPVTFKRKKLDKATPADPRVYAGLIAEDVALEAAAEPFLIRDAQGRPDGVHYAELVAPVAAVLSDVDRRLADLEARVALYVNLGSPA